MILILSMVKHVRATFRSKRDKGSDLIDKTIESQYSIPDGDQLVIGVLTGVRFTLDEQPQMLPKTRMLREHFASVSTDQCRDCESQHPSV